MATIPPLVFRPSTTWAGNDGNWSTFPLAVGTPPQRFDVLLSTSAGEVWIPAVEACSIPYPNCSVSRGIVLSQGSQPQNTGFLVNESSTWSQIGIYDLGLERSLFGDGDTGLYGQDILAIGDYVSGVENQTVAAIATPNFWVGVLGLGVQPPEFDVRPNGLPSLLWSMKAQNMIPSLSYGYSVGASFRSSPGSLVVGGYNEYALQRGDISFPVSYGGAKSLTVSVPSIVVSNTHSGTISMPIPVTLPLNMSIDSTVSHLWLPKDICDYLAEALDLSYDAETDLYLVNARKQLQQLSPEFTFTLAANSTSNQTLNIVLPYAAFDLQAGLPMYNTSTSYFPIRRANESLVLGRAFLQEAYVIVDWERRNFTLGQALHDGSIIQNIVSILSPEAEAPGPAHHLRATSIVGIAVGATLLVILLCGTAWFWWWRPRSVACVPNKDLLQSEESVQDRKVVPRTVSEMADHGRLELHENELKHQLMSAGVYELCGRPVEQELESRGV